MDKTQAIEEKRSMTEQVKQEAKREEEKKEEAKEAAKPPAAPATKAEAPAPKKEAKKEEKPKEKKPSLERIANIPIASVYAKSRSHRARIALSIVRDYAVRHAKATADKVKIEPKINELIGIDGARHPPRLVRVIIRKFDDGNTTVTLPPAEKKK